MKGEILSLDTTQKLASREKVIIYIKSVLERKTSSSLVETYLKYILDVLEGKNEN